MKKVILLALLMPYAAFGQVIENFESGSIINWVESTKGRWEADTTLSLSGKYSLHHTFDNPDAGIDRIGFQIKNLHPDQGTTRWSFLIKYGYDPSSLNNWSVLLLSDYNPAGMLADEGERGFALGVNLTGSDDTLRLWKINGTSITSIINCRINWQTDIGPACTVKILVERSQTGSWIVSVNSMSGDLVGTGSGFDNELFNPGWFGLYYKYSSTRDRLLWFDDLRVEGTFYDDTEPPVVIRCEPSGRKSIDITLSEDPANEIMIPENISLNVAENKPLTVIKISNQVWRFEFGNEFENKSRNNLNISKLCDTSGNCSQNVALTFTPFWAETGDIVISEIMADPVPVVSLPDKEYIEITNRTEYPLNLKNWRLSSTAQTAFFPEKIIQPAGIYIVCASQDTIFFNKYGNVIGIKQFPVLVDAGKLIYISDSIGNLIHGVEYESDWYKDNLKSQGGWSLEMMDTRFPFQEQENWKASDSRKGGTPGTVNSASESNPDISFSGITNVFPQDSTLVHLSFSEPVFNLVEKIHSISIEGNGINNCFSIDPLFREFSLTLKEPLKKNEINHLVIPGEVTDFAGNMIQRCDFSFGLPELANPGDVLFNEVLFNPLPGDNDFLELYNCSKKIIDASRLQVVSMDDVTGGMSDLTPVSDIERCLLPGKYYAVTTDVKSIVERYFSTNQDHLFELESIPAMSDDKGHLILFNRELDKIDELLYNDDMHYPLLTTNEGVSLEKSDPLNESEVRDNWHSASESSGWGTPGAPNSMYSETPSSSDRVVFSSSKITPDNDGNEDFLNIKMNLSGSGNVISVMVFDETGDYIRKIASNMFAGSKASVIWDGTRDDGFLVNTGIYIILITLYNDTGKTAKWKKVCTVIR